MKEWTELRKQKPENDRPVKIFDDSLNPKIGKFFNNIIFIDGEPTQDGEPIELHKYSIWKYET